MAVVEAYKFCKENYENAGYVEASPLVTLVERIEKADIMPANGTGAQHKTLNGARQVIYWDSDEGVRTDNGVILSPASILDH